MKNSFKKTLIALSTATLLATSSLPAFAGWFSDSEVVKYVKENDFNAQNSTIDYNCFDFKIAAYYYHHRQFDPSLKSCGVEFREEDGMKKRVIYQGSYEAVWLNAASGFVDMKETKHPNGKYTYQLDDGANAFKNLKIVDKYDLDIVDEVEFQCKGNNKCFYLRYKVTPTYSEFGSKACPKVLESNKNAMFPVNTSSCYAFELGDYYEEIVYQKSDNGFKFVKFEFGEHQSLELKTMFGLN